MTNVATIDSLQSALSGLTTTRARIDTISRNISNAGTDGYVKKIQTASTSVLGGAVAGPIQRSVDESLNRALNETEAEANRLQVNVKMLGNVEAVLGTPDAASSLASMMGALQNAFQQLSVSPQKDAAYGSTVSAASDVARTFQSLYSTMEDQRTEAATELKTSVDDVNSTLQQIAQTNQAIVVGGAGDPSDLEDQRDRLINKLNGLMEITTFKKTNGEIAVYTKNGQPLVDGTARPVDAAQLGAVQKPGGPPVLIVRSGTIGGLLQMRDVAMPQTEGQLDEIARSVAEEFRATGIELFTDSGNTTVDTTANPTQAAGYAGRIQVNDAYVQSPTLMRDGNQPAGTLGPADTTYIDKALDLFNRTDIAFHATPGLPAQGNLLQVTTDFIARRGGDRAAAQNALDHQNDLKQVFTDKISQVAGVSVDDELSQLVQLQQSYSAAAKIIQTNNDLLNSLLNSVQ